MKTIEEFIEDFRTHEIGYIASEEDNSEEMIRHLFHAGYCYYFALMLQTAYPGGEICWAYPYGHVVYVYNKKPYDIEGESITESNEFIPLSFWKEYLCDFLHNGTEIGITKEEMERIYEEWLKGE